MARPAKWGWQMVRFVQGVVVGWGLIAGSAPLAFAAGNLTPMQAEDAWHLCSDTASQLERKQRLPESVLEAITTVETGKAASGESIARPWPWTVTAEGKGQYFSTKKDAINAVRALRARGVESIDVGCMQVNLHYHPGAFTSLDEAFDPLANMTYAAALLKQLKASQNTWESAIEHYHSYDPEKRQGYRIRVFSSWQNISREREAFRLASAVSDEPLGAPGAMVRIQSFANQAPVTGSIDGRHRGASALGGPVISLASLDVQDYEMPQGPAAMVVIAVDLRPQPTDRPDPAHASVLGRTTVAIADPASRPAHD